MVSFRKNFAVVGGIYDPIRDAFLYLKPYESWILNESKCIWEAPIEYPNDNNSYWWDESNQSWSLITFQSEEE